MKKAELALLEKAFCAEVDGAILQTLPLVQGRRSKVEARLVADGCLERQTVTLPGRPPVTVSGYVLTHAGRRAYCMTCADETVDLPDA